MCSRCPKPRPRSPWATLAAIPETFFTAWGSLFECLRLEAGDTLLKLVGPATLRDSLRLLAPGGICCDTGILGGRELLDDFDPISEVPNGRYLTGFYSNYPTQETMAAIFEFVVEHRIKPLIAHMFAFEYLPDALAFQDTGGFQGKIVVVNED